jgi:hypothetical protein
MNDTPAFPVQFQGTTEPSLSGMQLRDYFAARILQTYMMNEVWNPETYQMAARTSYRVADEMMKARKE